MKDISANSIDLIICDLPYGCLTGGAGKEKARRTKANPQQIMGGCAWDIPLDLEAFWKEVKRIRRNDHTPTIHFCTTKFGYDLISSNPTEFRYDLVWDKQRGVSFLSANKMPMRSHEMIYVFSKVGAFYTRKDISGNFPNTISPNHKRSNTNTVPRVKDIVSSNEGKRCALSVIPVVGKLGKGNHPTQKPEALYRWLIERYCPTDGTVLDPTFGSGISVFTAHALGRNAIGIEKDEKFYKAAATRLLKPAEAQSQDETVIVDGDA
jgi:site-specific DNA-methyltransferase (adenine-specific)